MAAANDINALTGVNEEFARSVLPRRSPGAHKWGVGGLLIIGGAPGYLGAPALAAAGAMRAGAGVVSIAVSRSTMGVITSITPEATFVPLPDGDAIAGIALGVDAIAARFSRCHVAVVGCGLGEDEYAHQLLDHLFGLRKPTAGRRAGFSASASDDTFASEATLPGGKPVVIDADGLNWLAGKEGWYEALSPHTLVLTPHAGEMARLLGIEVGEVVANPHQVAIAAARKWQQTVVLKQNLAIATDGVRSLVASDAPLSLATAGSGDVFAGVIGAFLAQGLTPVDAAGLAIYTGTRAARRLEQQYGSLGVIASDLPAAYARELAVLER